MEEKLKREFEPTLCKIVDPHGDMNSVVIHVHSAKFKGMLPVARHRAINEVLKEEIKLIHAVQIDAKAVWWVSAAQINDSWINFVLDELRWEGPKR